MEKSIVHFENILGKSFQVVTETGRKLIVHRDTAALVKKYFKKNNLGGIVDIHEVKFVPASGKWERV